MYHDLPLTMRLVALVLTETENLCCNCRSLDAIDASCLSRFTVNCCYVKLHVGSLFFLCFLCSNGNMAKIQAILNGIFLTFLLSFGSNVIFFSQWTNVAMFAISWSNNPRSMNNNLLNVTTNTTTTRQSTVSPRNLPVRLGIRPYQSRFSKHRLLLPTRRMGSLH